MNVPTAKWSANTFRGKYSGCHTLAVFDAFFSSYDASDLVTFEGLTGIPFGVATLPQDPDRLIVPRLDPDLGIDIALKLLGLNVKTYFVPRGCAHTDAVSILARNLTNGPVLLGPLDMGGLDYLINHRLYAGCDHYVVALALDEEGLWVRDGEGVDLALIDLQQFLGAWQASHLREGRGSYTQRQVQPQPFPGVGPRVIHGALVRAAELIADCAASGPQVYRDLAAHESNLLNWPAARRSLGYLLSSRAQRSLAASVLVEDCRRWYVASTALDSVHRLYKEQAEIIAGVVGGVIENVGGCLQPLNAVAEIEIAIAKAFAQSEVANVVRI